MTKIEVLDAVNRLLVERWPDRTVYVDVCPVDFQRPSFWLAVEKDSITDANRFLVRHDLRLRLTLYDELDDHYEASWYRLARETDAAAELLGRVLSVGERHLELQLTVLPREADRAAIQIDTAWMDSRPGPGPGGVPPADSYSVQVGEKGV